MKNIAVITGASSGIGKAFCKIVDKKEVKIDEIWLIGRNKVSLEEVAQKLNHKTKVLSLDLSNSANLNLYRKVLEKQKDINITLLVNSAGFGIEGEFYKQSYVQIRNLIRVNIEALTSITYNTLKYMGPGSRIINIASSAAFLPQPYFAIYAASKSYVLSFTRAIREEVRKREIYVSAVCPGPVDTKFFDSMEETAKKLKFLGRDDAVKVALNAYYNNMQNKAVIVYGLPIKMFNLGAKLIPHEIMIRVYSVITDVVDKCKQTGKSSRIN